MKLKNWKPALKPAFLRHCKWAYFCDFSKFRSKKTPVLAPVLAMKIFVSKSLWKCVYFMIWGQAQQIMCFQWKFWWKFDDFQAQKCIFVKIFMENVRLHDIQMIVESLWRSFHRDHVGSTRTKYWRFEKSQYHGKPALKPAFFLTKIQKIDFFEKNAGFNAGFPWYYDFSKIWYIFDLQLTWFVIIIRIYDHNRIWSPWCHMMWDPHIMEHH